MDEVKIEIWFGYVLRIIREFACWLGEKSCEKKSKALQSY